MSAFTLSVNASALGAAKAVRGNAVSASRVSAAAPARRASVVVSAKLSSDSVQCTGNRVLVIADVAESKSAGGILLPSAAASNGPGSSITGKVKSVGADVKVLKAGDLVLINGFAGADVEFEDGSKGKFLVADDVLAIIS